MHGRFTIRAFPGMFWVSRPGAPWRDLPGHSMCQVATLNWRSRICPTTLSMPHTPCQEVPGGGVRPEVVTTWHPSIKLALVGQRRTAPQRRCGFYLVSKLVRGLENDGLTIAVTHRGDDPIGGDTDEIWGICFWMRSMEFQFP